MAANEFDFSHSFLRRLKLIRWEISPASKNKATRLSVEVPPAPSPLSSRAKPIWSVTFKVMVGPPFPPFQSSGRTWAENYIILCFRPTGWEFSLLCRRMLFQREWVERFSSDIVVETFWCLGLPSPCCFLLLLFCLAFKSDPRKWHSVIRKLVCWC